MPTPARWVSSRAKRPRPSAQITPRPEPPFRSGPGRRFASEGTCAAWIASALLAAASPAWAEGPATVLDHQVTVKVDAARRLTETVRWTVRVNDPAGCAAGIVAPPGLDGAVDGAAQVLETLFLAPPDTAPGTTYTFTATHTEPAGGHSGVVTLSPDVPTERATLVVDVPKTVPLAVWADPGAESSWGEPRRVEVVWDHVPAGTVAQAAWSTWSDWIEAGRGVRASVDAKVDERGALGKAAIQDLQGLGIGGVVARVREMVELDPGPSSWDRTSRARAVLAEGHGTAADRGVALIALLRAAGFDAAPAAYRSGSDPNGFPTTVPAPALFPQPLVVVTTGDGPVWIDPAADHTALPAVPASLAGATVWIPAPAAGAAATGQLPLRLADDPQTDGAVALTTRATIGPDGALTLETAVTATGAAAEILRDLLAPLDDAGRTETFGRLLSQARPGVDGVVAKVSGIEDPRDPLDITVQAHEPGALARTGFGLRGTIAPALAPALAAWLPPRIHVTETVALAIPTTYSWAGAAVDPSSWRTDASVARGLRREGQAVWFDSVVERPNRARTPATEAAAAEFLAAEAPKGVDALLFEGSSSIGRIRKAEDVDPAERTVLEMLVWYANDAPDKAARAARKLLARDEDAFDPLIEALVRFSDPTDPRPWQAIADQPGLAEIRRMELAEALERAGGRDEALAIARALLPSTDPEVRVRSRLAIERLQRLDSADDVEPDLLLQQAAGPGVDARVEVRRAELHLAAGDGPGARSLLDPLAASGTPTVRALLAHAGALTGWPADRVRAEANAAVEAAPDDAPVAFAAADALGAIGDPAAALDLATTAARLCEHDPDGWSRVVSKALSAGALRPAVDAARRASDLLPTDRLRATRWADLAFALGDRAQLDAARARAGIAAPADEAWPPDIDARSAVDPEAVLAVLVADEEAVAANPRLLAVRAQLRIERGMLDEAAQDGMILALRHGQADGWALAFAATAGRQYWTRARDALDVAARTEPTAMTTRMEYRLVTGGDPLEDAARLPEDPRAKALLDLSTDPAALAVVAGWPQSGKAPTASKLPGYRPNKLLSGVPGVVAVSNAASGATVAWVDGATGSPPPPFSVLYPDPPRAVLTLPDGGRVVRMSGGVMPVYAAVRSRSGQDVWAFAFAPSAAVRALSQALPAESTTN